MVVPCAAQLSDPNNDEQVMVPRRCSARIKTLKSDQEAQRQRGARCRSIDNPPPKTKVYSKKRKVDTTPSQPVQVDTTPSQPVLNDHAITVADPPVNEHPSGNDNDKSSHARVTDTLRKFNKHYLHFVQEEEIRCRRDQADHKAKKNSKSKEVEDDGKRSSKRPDLKAITKFVQNLSLCSVNLLSSTDSYREKLADDIRKGGFELSENWLHSSFKFLVAGIDVGHQFFSRAEMVVVRMHNHWLNGIDYIGQAAGKKEEYKGYSLPLAVSIVVSGQYEDDQDNYEEIVYTGQGGNDLLGNKRQIKDQVMERGNLGLKNCMEHSVPIRVTRGHRCVNSYVGKVYTYDGLYKVVNYWAEKGISGFTVYKFRLKRIEGQPVLTTNQVSPLFIGLVLPLVCEDISGGLEDIPIPATNLVDNPPVAPTGKFQFLDIMLGIIYAKGIKLPSAPTGCNCRGSCLDPRICSCAKLNGSDFPYVHKDGGRLIEPKAVVFECGPNCGCGPACVNRTSQKGLRYRLEVFRTPYKGWGVRSWDYIPSGATICEYIGLLKKTDQIDPAADNNYVFDIDCLQTMKGLDGREASVLLFYCPDFHFLFSYVMYRRLGEVSLPGSWQKDAEKTSDGGPEYCIDAVSVGNVSRFINHSCQPNLFVQCVLSTHHDIGLARVVLMAADNIPPLQELTYDYGYVLDSVLDRDGKVKQMACHCGAADCRKRLF
ncbi:Histone-lysine N-methyltransferase, H3 lysine-9 specific SUVH4 [Capsicum baccatum]|uniref:Histone-lysine N-methyltransferase, H3 lysine-9 specific SUVH4 n=1 Tax=Capsicum baccatum TaxID=33114 RepID=A0A2G2XI12_CAPBA|nr:Histone-lysine N-methyltransferase, H3 lysine-9 specific SUVH4 [Capsicum baccatum]